MTWTTRLTEMTDAKYLTEWLKDPQILVWFPMTTEVEVDDSVRIWMHYSTLQAGITACDDGTPIGMANLYLQAYGKFKHQCLLSIIVDEKYRGKGVGTTLLQALAKLAKEKHGITLLHLEVYDGNPAQKLYERMGFKVYGRHPRFIKEPDGKYTDKILMQKEL